MAFGILTGNPFVLVFDNAMIFAKMLKSPVLLSATTSCSMLPVEMVEVSLEGVMVIVVES